MMAVATIWYYNYLKQAEFKARTTRIQTKPYEKTNRMLAASSSGGHTSQSLEDKLQALKYFISGQGISFVVIKATTSELIGPKKKHLNYLITMSNEPNVSIPSMAKHLISRAKHPDWPIAFKSLITIHHLITYGHENFLQNIASSIVNSTAIDSLCSFVDQTTALAYNMSIFLRRYARYLSTKIQSYRTLGHDYCRTQANIGMRQVDLERLLQILPMIQEQFDALLAFDVSMNDLCNGIINSAFIMLYRDFIKLYIVYQAAIIRLLELFFVSDNLKSAREMFNLYKKFLVRMDKVSDFMPVINSVGLDKSGMPNLSRVPNLPLTMLEQHLKRLETANKRLDDHSLGRLEYSTLGRPRRRSLKTPTRQVSLDILSPIAIKNYKKRNEELGRLDRMLAPDSDRLNRGDAVSSRQNKDVIQEFSDESKTQPNEYEELDGAGAILDESSSRTRNANQTFGYQGQTSQFMSLDDTSYDKMPNLDNCKSNTETAQVDSTNIISPYQNDNDDVDALTSWVKI
jgi:hypothetical protein